MKLLIGVLLAVVFTLLISPVEIRVRAKQADLRDCLGSPFLFYAVILALGNIVAALLAFPLLDGQLAQSLSDFSPLMAAFAGVFAFEGVLSNTNITVFGKGVLTIDDWIEKARSSAVEFAVEKHARSLQDAVLKAADALRALPEDQLNAHLLRVLGTPEKLVEIELMATRSGANVMYYKALILANQFPEQAAAVVRRMH